MKRATLLLLLLITFHCILYSQNKTEKYFNSNFENISKKEFDDLILKDNYLYNVFELKNQFEYILYQRKTRGKLALEELNKLIAWKHDARFSNASKNISLNWIW